jgi:hypothetical protein
MFCSKQMAGIFLATKSSQQPSSLVDKRQSMHLVNVEDVGRKREGLLSEVTANQRV